MTTEQSRREFEECANKLQRMAISNSLGVPISKEELAQFLIDNSETIGRALLIASREY